MDVTQRIIDCAKERASGIYVEDLVIGVGYTGVKLSDGSGGVSYTFRNDLGSTCGVFFGAGKFDAVPAGKALDWAMSKNLAYASLGIAAANALLNRDYGKGPNIADAVECGSDDVVGMIGWFCPLVNRYRDAKKLYVFERGARKSPTETVEIRPEQDEEILLPGCDKVVITGTCFINKTADKLLAACRNAREIIIVGASTPMCPQVLREYGVTALAGTRISDPDLALRIVAQGGGGMDLSPASVKLFERI